MNQNEYLIVTYTEKEGDDTLGGIETTEKVVSETEMFQHVQKASTEIDPDEFTVYKLVEVLHIV